MVIIADGSDSGLTDRAKRSSWKKEMSDHSEATVDQTQITEIEKKKKQTGSVQRIVNFEMRHSERFELSREDQSNKIETISLEKNNEGRKKKKLTLRNHS
jgi:hypothetical protein